jgi:nicotinate-nucleotide--dimethylbenzimidazole phosphoribosyltransferase
VPNPSPAVADQTGTPSVAEAAALLAAGAGGELVLAKRRSAHATVAVARAAGAVDLLPEDPEPERPPMPAAPDVTSSDEPTRAFARAVARLVPPDEQARADAVARHLQLTKPPGSLGRLESLGAQLAAIAGVVPPPIPTPAAVAVFAGDHGVHAEGVTPWPQEVTGQMVANFVAGGAAINVLARQQGADVVVVDVGVAFPVVLDAPGLLDRNIRRGTANLAAGPATSIEEAQRALDVGAEIAADLVARGHRALVTGDMGIANTTPSAALIATLTGRAAAEVTGRGTGIDDPTLAHKTDVVEAAAARVRGADPLTVLAEVGGLEIAALAGFIVGGAAARVPVVVDGVIAGAALLVASRLAPACVGYAIPGHRSVEPGASAVLAELDLVPVVDLDLRLGEGTGACLALPIVEAAALVLAEMATFDSAGVTEKD